MTQTTPVSDFAFQNSEVKNLARESYGHGELEALRALLRDHQTMRLVRYSTGGCSAVTPIYDDAAQNPFLCLEAAMSGLLNNMWDRDSILQACGEWMATVDPALGEGLRIDSTAFIRGLMASVNHHFVYRHRFLDIIKDRRSGLDFSARPNIRYNSVDLFELSEPWGHAQNDALGAINFFVYFCLNRGWLPPEMQDRCLKVTALIHAYFWKLHVWEDWDLGAWEDVRGEHASSILVVHAGLLEQLQYLKTHDINGCHVGEDYFAMDAKGTQELIDKCDAKLREILPNEYIRGDGGVRSSDAALVNGLFLLAMSEQFPLDEALVVSVIDRIENELSGHIGIARYKKDVWDGRVNREMPEAQWSHVAPMISFIFGRLYRQTNKEEYRVRQVNAFNKALSCVNPRFHMPEAYIARSDNNGGWIWESDANESLAWAQAMLIAAFAGMKATIDHKVPAAAEATSQSGS